MEEKNRRLCLTLISCFLVEFAFGSQNGTISLAVLNQHPNPSISISIGNGTVSHPYKGLCNQLQDALEMHLTFPGHLVNSSTDTSLSDINEYLSQIFDSVAQDLDNCSGILINMLPVLDHLTNENQQEDAIREYRIDSANISITFGSLRSKVSQIKRIVGTLLANDVKKINKNDIKREFLPIALDRGAELLQMFDDSESVFRKHPLLSAPYFLIYVGLHFSIVKIALQVENNPFNEQFYFNSLNKLKSLIEIYKDSTVKERQNQVDGHWPLNCKFFYIFWPTSCYNPTIVDTISKGTFQQFVFSSDFTMEEAKVCYRKAIRMKYQTFFSVITTYFKDVDSDDEEIKIETTNTVIIEKTSESSDGLFQGFKIVIILIVLFLLTGILLSILIVKRYLTTATTGYGYRIDPEESFEFDVAGE